MEIKTCSIKNINDCTGAITIYKHPIKESEYGGCILTMYDSNLIKDGLKKLMEDAENTKSRLKKLIGKMGKNTCHKFGEIEVKQSNSNMGIFYNWIRITWKFPLVGRKFVIKRLDDWSKPPPPRYPNKKNVPKRKRGKPIYPWRPFRLKTRS